MVNETKTTYEAPTVEKLGDFETLTQHTNTGTKVDVALSAGESILGHLS